MVSSKLVRCRAGECEPRAYVACGLWAAARSAVAPDVHAHVQAIVADAPSMACDEPYCVAAASCGA